ncbi:serine hydrolase [Bacillus sp. B15-48]|uniref:serine hydrolase domain-containing protein n=1 Tax=Bacillus sp. B15-48 TaxID=1548601 RepID=UPI00193ED5AC|nr:serine hydrolase [Bacillus sp. B15-48]
MRKFSIYCLCFLCIFTLKLNPTSASTNLDDVKETIVSFMNDLYENQLQHLNTVGSEIVIVKDGEIIYEQASGYEDEKAQKEVSIDETRFRIASISKTFTALAVMKLVEEGKIDLDENVNHYLSTFQIPDTFDEPITMRHLVTHTAGFDDKLMGMGDENWQDTESLREHLAENMPKRIREPGKFFQYSNHGLALACLH